MKKFSLILLLMFCLFGSCTLNRKTPTQTVGKEIKLQYARHLKMVEFPEYMKVVLANPWKEGVLHTYYLVKSSHTQVPPDGTKVVVPIKKSVIFTTAHANLMELLGAGHTIAGVADLQYMLIPDIQSRVKKAEGSKDKIVDCGASMKPNVEKIIRLKPDAIFVSPFENSGGYGRLEALHIPLIECADYMETSALGRAEWMKFYGMLVGKEHTADSLFAVVEKNYKRLKGIARKSKKQRSVLPDRKVGAVWYIPGGQSSVGLLYSDALGSYAYAQDRHSGSLSLPFEKIIEKFSKSDFWILSYNGKMDRERLLAEYANYAVLKPFQTGEVYGCRLDKTPYFEEVSWRPDLLLQDLIQLFHPDLHIAPMRYYHKLW